MSQNNLQERVKELVRRVLNCMNSEQAPDVIVVFTRYKQDTNAIAHIVRSELPTTYNSSVELYPIEESTSVLRGVHKKGTRTFQVFYDPNVFRFITSEQFLKTNEKWLRSFVYQTYLKEPDIHNLVSSDDLYSECYFHLDKILSKYEEQCSIRTFVANRLRRYLENIVEKELRNKLVELQAQQKAVLKLMGNVD